jgi:hypothetical protein
VSAVNILVYSVLQLCKANTVAPNPLEAAKICVMNGKIDLALLLLHAPLTNYFSQHGGLRLVAPWEEVVDLCVFSKEDLEKAGIEFRELPSFTATATIRESDEEGERKVSTPSYYAVYLELVDTRSLGQASRVPEEQVKKVLYVYLVASILPNPVYSVYIVTDRDKVEPVGKLCRSLRYSTSS